MRPVLVVTGAGGWFGHAFLDSLTDPSKSAGFGQIRALVADRAEGESVQAVLPASRVFVGDVRSETDVAKLFEGVDDHYLVHAAGVIHPVRVADFEAVNADGTRRVVAHSLQHGLRRMVHISSNSPIGVNPDPLDTFRDQEPYSPYLGYGRSKMRAEIVVQDLLTGHGVPGTILRPPWFYGPHQPARQAKFLKTVRMGKFPMVGDGRNRRSMVYTDDLAAAVHLALATRTTGIGTYWVADERPYSMLEILAAVRQAARDVGLEVVERQLRLPSALGDVAARLDAFLQQRGRYQQELHVAGELNKNIACRIDGAREALGYRPTVGLLEGMRRSYRYGLANGQDV